MPLTHSPQNVLSPWLTVLYWAFFSNCEAFSAQPELRREREEAKWKSFQTKFDFLPIAFAKQLKKMPARGPALSSSDENGYALCTHNKPGRPRRVAGINYTVEVKYILRTKAMIDGFFVQKIPAHLRFNHFLI